MNEQNLSVLFNALEQSKKTNIVNNKYELSELTLEQQQEIINTVFNPYEASVRLTLAFNNIIRQCISMKDGSNILDETIDKRPILIRELRDLSVGNIIERIENDETIKLKLKPINYKKLNKTKIETNFTINDLIHVSLAVPTFKRDNIVNQNLLQELSNYRRRIEHEKTEMDPAVITTIYLHFELIRYIDKLKIQDEEYNFSALSVFDQKRAIQGMPNKYIEIISQFIKNIKDIEKTAFTIDNDTEEIIEMTYNIFSKEL